MLAAGCSKHVNTAVRQIPDAIDIYRQVGAIQVNPTNPWNPNIKILEQAVLDDTNLVGLDHDVKNFYEHLHKKDWKATYELRSQTFRSDFPEDLYLSIARGNEKFWQLSDYSVLSVSNYDATDAVLKCKFVEFPGPDTTYSSVDWHKEKDGVWRCDGAGPSRLPIFPPTRYDPKTMDK